ncbi:hypothetical protein N9Z02_02010 [Akkermansiaceae bacterium]|nr:hypothetical protein [Akkermansiaceae bacterium]
MAESLKAYSISLATVVVIGVVAHFLDFEDRNFWKMLCLVGIIAPFFLAREAWIRAERETDFENFTEQTMRISDSVELPEISLGGDELVGKRGISIARVGEAEKSNEAMALIGLWERIEQMDEGPGKEAMKRVFNEKLVTLSGH